MSETEAEPTAGAETKGAYYCPGCGRRYETAGACVGKAEAGHEEIQVEKVHPEAEPEAAEPKAEPKPKAKPKAASKKAASKK